jgi:hypothetical protein
LSLEAVFGSGLVERSGQELGTCLAGETEEVSLLAPVVWWVLAQPQKPRRRELDWLTALKERAHDARSETRQSNERSEMTLAHPEAFGHGLDTVIRSGQQLVSDRESLFDQFDEAFVDFCPYSRRYAVSKITFFHQPHPTTLDPVICT